MRTRVGDAAVVTTATSPTLPHVHPAPVLRGQLAGHLRPREDGDAAATGGRYIPVFSLATTSRSSFSCNDHAASCARGRGWSGHPWPFHPRYPRSDEPAGDIR